MCVFLLYMFKDFSRKMEEIITINPLRQEGRNLFN